MLIHALYQIVTKHFDSVHKAKPDTPKVLLTAYSGKAAHLIHGTTLHTAFALPVNQYGSQLTPLSNEIANKIRVQLFDLKLIIMDECSMIGTKMFTQINERLVQVFGRNEWFGGISVIVVGDMNQLPPVADQKIFVQSRYVNNTALEALIGPLSKLWEPFEIFELTQIMRQKDEKDFIIALNNLASETMTDADVQLIKSRETPESEVPENAIRVFYANNDVDNYNTHRIQTMSGGTIQCTAIDHVDAKASEAVKRRTLYALKNKKRNDCFGMAYTVDLKIGIRYMITTIIDIEDGIVNGACGTLKYIQFHTDLAD